MIKIRIWSFSIIVMIWMLTNADAGRLQFTPTLEISEEYSDNIFLSPQDEEDDFITTTGLSLTGRITGRTAGLEINYSPSYSAFAENGELDYWRHSAYVSAYKDFSRSTRLEFHNDFLETEDPLDESTDLAPTDPLEGPAIGIDTSRRGRTRYLQNLSSARLSRQFGANDLVYVEIEYGILRDQDALPGQAVDDYDIWQPELGLNYWFTPLWGIEFDGFHSIRDYVDENDRKESTGNLRLLRHLTRKLTGFAGYRRTELDYEQETDSESDYQIHEPFLGLRYQLQETAHITLSAGYYFQEFSGEREDDEGPAIDSVIFKRWDLRSGYIDLTGGSGYQIDDPGTEDLGLNIYFAGRLEIGYNFTQRLSAHAYGACRYDEYPDETPDRADKITNAGVGIGYQVLQWMHVGLNYDFRDFQSDIETLEYTENRAILTIAMTPVSPIHLNR